jgi:hypothetical protein
MFRFASTSHRLPPYMYAEQIVWSAHSLRNCDSKTCFSIVFPYWLECILLAWKLMKPCRKHHDDDWWCVMSRLPVCIVGLPEKHAQGLVDSMFEGDSDKSRNIYRGYFHWFLSQTKFRECLCYVWVEADRCMWDSFCHAASYILLDKNWECGIHM